VEPLNIQITHSLMKKKCQVICTNYLRFIKVITIFIYFLDIVLSSCDLSGFTSTETISMDFQSKTHFYVRDSYQIVISKISKLNLINVCCPNHPHVLPYLIFEYVQIRFYFESKRIRNRDLAKPSSKAKDFSQAVKACQINIQKHHRFL